MTPVIQGLHGLTGGFSGSFLDFSQTQIFDIFASSLCPSLLLTPPLGGDLHAPYFFSVYIQFIFVSPAFSHFNSAANGLCPTAERTWETGVHSTYVTPWKYALSSCVPYVPNCLSRWWLAFSSR